MSDRAAPPPEDPLLAPLALGPGREFDVVRKLVDRWGTRARAIGSDCAVLDAPPGERIVATTDSSVEGVHFRRDWLDAADIGYRATAAAISDLAAAAARPLGVLLALTLPAAWRDAIDDIADGVGDAAADAGAPIVGGDLSAGDRLSFTVTAIGSARVPLSRGGAQPGDALWVTGRLGGPLAALRQLRAGRALGPALRERFARPRTRIREAQWLAANGARAAVDISDGLAADARHIAAASNVRLWLDADRIPLLPDVDVATALASGEEYELLVAAPPSLDAAAFVERFGIPLTAVGEVRQGAPGVAARVDLPGGHDHFSS